MARACSQAGPAGALFCLAALFYSEKQIDGGVVAMAEDGGDVPALHGCPDWLCKPSSAPRLAPALKLGQGAQNRNGPRLLQSWLPSLLSVMAYLYHDCSGAGGSLS